MMLYKKINNILTYSYYFYSENTEYDDKMLWKENAFRINYVSSVSPD